MPTISDKPFVPAKTASSAAVVEGGNAAVGAGIGAIVVSLLRATLDGKLPWAISEDVYVAGAITALVAAISKWLRKRSENKKADAKP